MVIFYGVLIKKFKQSIISKRKLPNIKFEIFDAVILSDEDTNFKNAIKISEHSKIVCFTMGKKGVKIITNKFFMIAI